MADFTIDTEDTVYPAGELQGRFEINFAPDSPTDEDMRVFYVVRDVVAQLVRANIVGLNDEVELALIVDVDATSITITLDSDPPTPD